MKNELDNIKNLVGNIDKGNLKYVDYYVEKDFGLFIPVVGFCEYAIMKAHVHPSYSFIIYFNNNSLFPSNVTAKNNEYLVQGISPEFPHEEEIGEKFNRYIAIFISKNLYEKEYLKYKDNIDHYKFNSFTVNRSIMTYIEKYISEHEWSIPSRESMLKSISTIITNDLIRGILNLDFNRNIGVKRLEVEKIINYMHQNFSDKITISKLACLCNMSESSLNKVFKEELLYSPIEYLINIRLDKAKKLLRSKSKSITEIALECGFSSLSHFSYCFTKVNNISPRSYMDVYK